MYSFQPLIDAKWDSHTGFYGVTVIMILWFGLIVYGWAYDEFEDRTLGIWFIICLVIVCTAHYGSYQPERIYANTKVTGEFVQFNPEIWVEKSGKSTTTRRNMFVTYRVGNDLVVLPAQSGATYPKTAVLYKN